MPDDDAAAEVAERLLDDGALLSSPSPARARSKTTTKQQYWLAAHLSRNNV